MPWNGPPNWQKRSRTHAGRKPKSKSAYTKGVEERLYLGKVNDRIRIARTYERLGDYDNAMLYYKKALELSPQNATVLMSIANLAEKARQQGPDA